MGFWPVVNNILKQSDLLVVVGDARMPEDSLNQEIIGKIENLEKAYVIVFTKVDLVSKESLAKLKNKYRGAFFVSGTKNIDVGLLRKHLIIQAKKMKLPDLRVGIVGYPNIGKSALINALVRRARTLVADSPGTTKGTQWVKANGFLVLDTPGVIPFDDRHTKLGLLGAKSPDHMRNPEKVAFEIIRKILSSDKKTLLEHYNIDANISEMSIEEIFNEIGKKRGYLMKGGGIDEHRTAVAIVREWQRGKLRLDS
jgi:ribosome biogenesis GTPase A